MPERAGVVTMKGSPLTLLGREVRVGDRAPEFNVTRNDLSPAKLADFKGKALILSSVPSLDTPVCSIETRRFNEEASKLGPDVLVLTFSMDLPFAQRRWCAAEGVERVITLSDHRDASFGMNYGVLIKELRLLARAVFVVDRGGVVRYAQLAPELTHEPDYAKVIEAAQHIK